VESNVPTCVLLAESHHDLGEGMRGLLETAFDTVFTVADEASLADGARRLSPDVIVADWSLGAGDPAGFAQRLCRLAGNAKVLLLSLHDAPSVAQQAFAAGADAVVLKRAVATDLLAAIDSLKSGIPYVSPAMLGGKPDKDRSLHG